MTDKPELGDVIEKPPKPTVRTRARWWLHRVREWPGSWRRRRLRRALRRYAAKHGNGYMSHARRELIAVGYDPNDREPGPDKWIQEDLIELLAVFGMQGHSGMSAPYCVNAFKKLALFEPLCPLTGEEPEWNEVCEGMWQNNRCGHVFKDADGNAYDGEGRIFRKPGGACYTSSDSHVPVTFPYTPKREFVDVPEPEDDDDLR